MANNEKRTSSGIITISVTSLLANERIEATKVKGYGWIGWGGSVVGVWGVYVRVGVGVCVEGRSNMILLMLPMAMGGSEAGWSCVLLTMTTHWYCCTVMRVG